MNFSRHTFALWAALSATTALAADGNRLAYLDQLDPYDVSRSAPRLTTPQWVGEEGVEAVVVLAIDDMRGVEKWEAFLRPLLERLKKIDGRAPVSIMTCLVDPADAHLQTWLREGLSIEVHTVDHPCPLLKDGDFAKAKSTFDRCLDSIAAIPGNRPVAFRMPCCDSLNTLSPRFFSEIFNRKTPGGNFLAIDSSVFNILTSNDPDTPRELVLDSDGRDKFRKYVPFPSFVNTIEDYPYPYPIGGLCWEFPCVVPSDWSAQNLQQPNNPDTLRDLKAALDIAVRKRGTYNLVFHPHGWIRSEQLVSLVDHAVSKHGRKVKFLTFREALQRINKNVLAGRSLRGADGGDGGVRLLDLNNDGYLDAVARGEQGNFTRLWQPATQTWKDVPLRFASAGANQPPIEALRFGVFHADGAASVVFAIGNLRGGATFRDGSWHADDALSALPPVGQPPRAVLSSEAGRDRGLRFRDLDGDGICECLVSNEAQQAAFRWSARSQSWTKLRFTLPEGTALVTATGADAGLRFVDLDEDGYDDVVFANGERYSIQLFESLERGWSRPALSGKHGDGPGIPPIVRRDGTNNGVWFHSRRMWAQNEDTARLADLVDRRSYNDLLRSVEPRAKSPAAALWSLRARPGFVVEQMAAEPLTMDPVAFAFGPDGKLWVAEMADYPLGIDGHGKHGGRVRYLEDSDGDGRYDRSTLFLDGLGYPNGVVPWRGGVLVTCAPEIFYAEDTDGDGRADRRVPLFTGFGEGNQQHRMNGLRWGMDGWLYCANGDSGGKIRSAKTGQDVSISGRDFRIRPDEGLIDPQAGQSQFGRNRDDWDNWFGCNNADPMFHFALADHYLRRNTHVAPPNGRFDVSVTPGVAPVYPLSRTLARFNDLHTANRFTSACSTMIYRDELFGPTYIGNSFVCEPVHNLVHREVVEPAGLTFSSRRAPDEQTSEFLASSDNWFRPVMVQTGPDGALWIADMYRQVIEHPEWIPDDWQKRLDLRAGHDKGRIYRVYPVGTKPRPIARLDKLPLAELVAALDSPNGPQRDLVQQMLIWRGDKSAAPLLANLARSSTRPVCRAQALCTLEGIGSLTPDLLLAALADEHAGVRRHAVRLFEPLLASDARLGEAIARLADDADLQVQLQRAYTLGQWRNARAGAALGAAAVRWRGEPLLLAAVLSSVHADNIEAVLSAVLKSSGPGGPPPKLVEQLASLATALERNEAVASVLHSIAQSKEGKFAPWQVSGLSGLLDALARRRVPLDKLLDRPGELDKLFDYARSLSGDEKASDDERAGAVRLLGRQTERRAADVAALAALLVPRNGAALQAAAADALARIDHADVPRLLLAGWRSYGPALRTQVLDLLLSRAAGIEAVLAAIEERKLPAADIDAAHRLRLVRVSNEGLRRRAERALAGAVDANRQQVLEKHRAVLDVTGDATAGAAVFTKRCAVCHKVRGEGHEVGPDLAALTDNSPQALLVGILDPNRAVESKFVEYLAVTSDGRQLSGMLAGETGGSITLLGQESKQQVLLRSDLEDLRSTGRSLMPEGMEKDLSPRDLADVIAYLRSTGPPRKQFPLSNPAVVQPASDGALTLTATDCEIYGSTLVLEGRYRNLGFWSSQNDRAVWTLDVPRGGTYGVRLDYACADNSAGNYFTLEAGSQSLTWKVAGSGTWDDYRQANVGRLTLQSGRQQIIVHSLGPIRGAMIDLKAITLRPDGK